MALRRSGSGASDEDGAGETQPLLPQVLRRRATRLPPDDLEAAAPQPSSSTRAGSGIPVEIVEDLRVRSDTNDTITVDVRRAFVLDLLKRPELMDPRINKDSLSKGQAKLLEALDRVPMTGGVEEDLPNLLIFKGRPLFSACVLHLAVWCSARLHEASLVEAVLRCQSFRETQFQAKYELLSRKEGWKVELRMDAIHVAAGLGCMPAVESLVRHVAGVPVLYATSSVGVGAASVGGSPTMSPASKPLQLTRDYVSQYTVKFHRNEETGETMSENFYCPIHEATAQGFIDVALYLLQWGADGGVPNSDGVAPLHFVAMQGCAGGLLTGMQSSEQATVRALVQGLQDANGSLECRVNPKHWNQKLAGKTPLQLAASDDSRFPRQMMGLLVPCLQDDSVAEPRFFADIVFLTALDAEAAAGVVRDISTRAARSNAILQRFRMDAQKPGRTDMLASILFLAPEAGGCMLEMLVGDPIVKDVSKHNIPTRTSLYGFWKHLPMRCAYRGDADYRDGILAPVWNFHTDRPFEKQAEIQWHRWLVPETSSLAKRTDYVYCISVSALLLPNMLDLDMFMALSRVLRPHMKVFSKLPVQGMIYCLWNNLVEGIWLAELLFHLLELVVLMWWSLSWPVYGPRGAIHADEPLFWAVITAGCIREATQGLVGMWQAWSKWNGHNDTTMRSLWHPFSDTMIRMFVWKFILVATQTRFIYGARDALDERDFNPEDQVLLAVVVLLKSAQVTYSFRLCAGGSKIYAIFYSFLGGATREMISITAMIFGSFSLAFMVLAKDKAAGWVVASSYRGLLFGDGDGFNNLGMDVHESGYQQNDGVLMFFLVGGSFFFNIIILNLIIAVYGNEYDKVAGETPLLFLHGRARSCVQYILTCQVFPWSGEAANSLLWMVSLVLALAGVMSHVGKVHKTWEPFTAFFFASAQVILMAALAQADWYSIEGVAADQKDRFLWICHRDNVTEEEGANEALQVGYFEDRLLDHRRYVDKKLSGMETKLDTILQLLTESQ